MTVRKYRCAECGSPAACVRATMRDGETLARNVADSLVPQRSLADARDEFACSGCGWAFTFRPGEAWATGPFRYCPGCGVSICGNCAL